ncbi:MAG TPA: hypothetical protein VGP88_03845 [Thermoplasmata archaeon]|nr:hypothetical protein [Thermoplasmata archaeon]
MSGPPPPLSQPPNAPPPPPMWTPMGVPQRRMMIDPWPLLGFWARAVGFLLLFLGTLIVVSFASPGGGCVTTPSSCSGFAAQALNAVLAGKILWVLGLGALGAGAAIRLHWGLRMPENPRPDEVNFVLADRRANGLLFILSMALLLLLYFQSSFLTLGLGLPPGL